MYHWNDKTSKRFGTEEFRTGDFAKYSATQLGKCTRQKVTKPCATEFHKSALIMAYKWKYRCVAFQDLYLADSLYIYTTKINRMHMELCMSSEHFIILFNYIT